MAKILIIEDDAELRATLQDFLVAGGHTVTTADDGLEGTRRFRSDPSDLILVDMVMPYSGLATIRVLHSQFPGLRVIGMSGGGAHRLGYARDLGASCTLTKPFTGEELDAAIAVAFAEPVNSPVR